MENLARKADLCGGVCFSTMTHIDRVLGDGRSISRFLKISLSQVSAIIVGRKLNAAHSQLTVFTIIIIKIQ